MTLFGIGLIIGGVLVLRRSFADARARRGRHRRPARRVADATAEVPRSWPTVDVTEGPLNGLGRRCWRRVGPSEVVELPAADITDDRACVTDDLARPGPLTPADPPGRRGGQHGRRARLALHRSSAAPLVAATLRRALIVPGGLWTELTVVAVTGSTNADVAAAARAGAEPRAWSWSPRAQTAGRGRLGRAWQAPSRAGDHASACCCARRVPVARPRLAAAAGRRGAGRGGGPGRPGRRRPEVAQRPAGPGHGRGQRVRQVRRDPGRGRLRRVRAGASAASTGQRVVGIGLNVSQRADELPPVPTPRRSPPTSLALAGAACTDRDPLLRAVLRSLADWYGRWADARRRSPRPAALLDGVPATLRDARPARSRVLHARTAGS